MTRSSANRPQHFDIVAAKKAYDDGKNVTQFLKNKLSIKSNTASVIEVAYDIQAGSYTEYVKNNPDQTSNYFHEISDIIESYVDSIETLLDIGTGEMTTLTGVLNNLSSAPKRTLAFDISWSRIAAGLDYIDENLNATTGFHAFVSDIGSIPLHSGSVDIITSSHALEPNGDSLDILLTELLRISKKMLILFEPCYEINSDEGKRRMDENGYIKDIEGMATSLGGKVIDTIRINNISTPLNPTVCFVITPPSDQTTVPYGDDFYTVPGTDLPLIMKEGFYFSNDTGLSFPILKGIPILRNTAGILSTRMVES
jgi:hypothetical protein